MSVSLDFYEGTTQGKKNLNFCLRVQCLCTTVQSENLEKGHKDVNSIVYFKMYGLELFGILR